MIDEQFIKSILFPEETERRKIQPGDYISAELVELMKTASQSKIRACFAILPKRKKGDSLAVSRYSVEAECAHCHKYFVKEMGKDEIILYISHKDDTAAKRRNWRAPDVLCTECFTTAENEHKKELQDMQAQRERSTREETARFIGLYLKEGYDFSKPSHTNYWDVYNACKSCDIEEIAAYIKAMEYQDFLDTPYWKAISRYIKFKAGYKCMMCGRTGVLNAHHRDYSQHGYELQRCNSELICLCESCHKHYHENRRMG